MSAGAVFDGPQPIARSIEIGDLPVGRTEIELSAPPTEITVADGITQPKKIMALIRLHSYPLGVVCLDGTLGTRWKIHQPQVWAELGAAISVHLATDGLPPVTSVAEIAPTDGTTTCTGLRRTALETPRFATVCVATRDRTDSLRACLNALLAMSYPNFEIVVVDNDPTSDDSMHMVAAEFGDNVRYAREMRRGLASAHNRGVEEARGEIIAFVDDDVLVDREWLTALAEGFAAGTDVGCVSGLILPAQLHTEAQLLLERHGGFDKGFERRIFDLGANRPADDPLFPFTAGKLGSGANMAFDTRILREIGSFDPVIGVGTRARGGDDLAGFFRVIARGHQLVYQPAAIVWHRHHRDMAALRNQVQGYGVGLGAYLTSVIVNDPRMLGRMMRSLPKGVRYAFSGSSARNAGRYDGWPKELTKLERRGLLSGPYAYAASRRAARRAAKTASRAERRAARVATKSG